jgi:hypothetical protein
MCMRNLEFMNHLLLRCEIAKALWDVIFDHIGLVWIMTRQVVDLYAS